MEIFERRFNTTRNLAKGIIGFTIIMMFLIIIINVVVGVYFINNPEAVGEFFGKIANGFNSAK